MARGRQAATLTFFQNHDLYSYPEAQGYYSPEPAVASNGNTFLETWNRGAGFSTDGGVTMHYLNPIAVGGFDPDTASGGNRFCCDQVVTYIPGRDLYVWLMQGSQMTSGTNTDKLAVAHGTAGLLAGAFKVWTLTPSQIGDPTNWFDYPSVSHTNNYVFISMNEIHGTSHANDVEVRIPISSLDSGAALTLDYYHTGIATPVTVTGSTSTMYFALLLNTGTIRVYSWPDASGTAGITSFDTAFSADPNIQTVCKRTGTAPNWCGTAFHSPRSAWVSGGVIGLAWTGAQGTTAHGTYAYPYVHVIRIDETTHKLAATNGETFIWSPNYAYAYPSITANARGDLAGTVMWGGGAYFQNCGVLVHDSMTTGGFWDFYPVTQSAADPPVERGGDYLSTQADATYSNSWSGTCYSIPSDKTVHPFYLEFGRPGTGPPPPAPPPPPPPVPDTSAPSVGALPAAGRRGRKVRLRFRVYDDRGEARERVAVFRGKRKIGSASLPLQAVDPGVVYSVLWKAPRKKMKAKLKFCVKAWDAANNASALRCARIRLR